MVFRCSLGVIAIVLICGCSSPASVPKDPQDLVEGTWSQTFLYRPGPGSAVRVNPIDTDIPVEYKTTQLIFGDSVFSWTCTPPEHYLDGHVLGELLTGRYEVVRDELRLLGYNAPEWDQLFVGVEDDTLRIAIVATPTEGGLIALPAYSWLWANSLGRTEGTFVRVSE